MYEQHKRLQHKAHQRKVPSGLVQDIERQHSAEPIDEASIVLTPREREHRILREIREKEVDLLEMESMLEAEQARQMLMLERQLQAKGERLHGALRRRHRRLRQLAMEAFRDGLASRQLDRIRERAVAWRARTRRDGEESSRSDESAGRRRRAHRRTKSDFVAPRAEDEEGGTDEKNPQRAHTMTEQS
ncbi:MAG: hypothetical protein MHM6MM_005290 [Cercozoa sp. M6MM]